MELSRINKRGVFEFKKGFHAIVIFSMLIIAIGLVVTGWSTTYDSGLSNDLGEFNKLNNISEEISGQKDSLSANDPDPGSDAEGRTFRGVYSILTNIFLPFNLVFGSEGILIGLGDRFGVPSYIIQGIMTMMFVTITMALIGIIFRLGRNA